MIQRIQSLYLLIVAILTFLVAKFPLMELVTGDGTICNVNVLGVYAGNNLEYSVWVLLALSIINILIATGTILLFKKRILQIRLSVFNILLIIGFYILLGVYYWVIREKFSAEVINFKWTVMLPAINIVLSYLAIRAIGKDEAMVRAVDRLRY